MAQCGRTGAFYDLRLPGVNNHLRQSECRHVQSCGETFSAEYGKKTTYSLHVGLHQDVKTYTGHRDEANARNRDL